MVICQLSLDKAGVPATVQMVLGDGVVSRAKPANDGQDKWTLEAVYDCVKLTGNASASGPNWESAAICWGVRRPLINWKFVNGRVQIRIAV